MWIRIATYRLIRLSTIPIHSVSTVTFHQNFLLSHKFNLVCLQMIYRRRHRNRSITISATQPFFHLLQTIYHRLHHLSVRVIQNYAVQLNFLVQIILRITTPMDLCLEYVRSLSTVEYFVRHLIVFFLCRVHLPTNQFTSPLILVCRANFRPDQITRCTKARALLRNGDRPISHPKLKLIRWQICWSIRWIRHLRPIPIHLVRAKFQSKWIG